MALVKGKTLWNRVRKFHRALKNTESSYDKELVEMLRIWTMATNTIAYAHAHGVLHRDLKSDNVIVGEYGQVTVIDWGLAKSMSHAEPEVDDLSSAAPIDDSFLALDARRGTIHGARLGTPAFMAPEQARGDIASVDQRTDIYALSAMLYEILTGQTPYSADDPEEMMHAVQFDSLVPPSELVAEIPLALDEICCKGLAKNPDERFQSAGELSSAVEQWMAKEAMRRHSEQAHMRVFNMSDDLMLITNQQQRVTWANAAWKKVLGRDPETMIGDVPRDWEHNADVGGFASDFRFLEELARREAVKGVRRALMVDGKPRWFSWTVAPVADEGITIVVGRDIDELVKKSKSA